MLFAWLVALPRVSHLDFVFHCLANFVAALVMVVVSHPQVLDYFVWVEVEEAVHLEMLAPTIVSLSSLKERHLQESRLRFRRSRWYSRFGVVVVIFYFPLVSPVSPFVWSFLGLLFSIFQ